MALEERNPLPLPLQELLLDRQELQTLLATSHRPHVREWLQGLLGEIQVQLCKVLGEEVAAQLPPAHGLQLSLPHEPQTSAPTSTASSLSSSLQDPMASLLPHSGAGEGATVIELLRRCGISSQAETPVAMEGASQGALDELFRTQLAERQALAHSFTNMLPAGQGGLMHRPGALDDVHARFHPQRLPQRPPPALSAVQLVPIRLDTCSFEQSPESLKIYVPLRGVQTEMLRTYFTVRSAEVKVYNLHGRNYVFSLQPTTQPIVPHACFAVASKTRKNILITLQKLNTASHEERQWPGLRNSDVWGGQPPAGPPSVT